MHLMLTWATGRKLGSTLRPTSILEIKVHILHAASIRFSPATLQFVSYPAQPRPWMSFTCSCCQLSLRSDEQGVSYFLRLLASRRSVLPLLPHVRVPRPSVASRGVSRRRRDRVTRAVSCLARLSPPPSLSKTFSSSFPPLLISFLNWRSWELIVDLGRFFTGDRIKISPA